MIHQGYGFFLDVVNKCSSFKALVVMEVVGLRIKKTLVPIPYRVGPFLTLSVKNFAAIRSCELWMLGSVVLEL